MTKLQQIPLGVRLFLSTAILYGSAMAVAFGLVSEPLAGASSGIVAGLMFGGTMALVLGLGHVLAVTRMGERPASLGVRQTREVLVPGGRDPVVARVRAALAEAGVRADDGGDGLRGRTGVSWRSFGEVVTATVTEGAGGCVVSLHSAPWLRTTLVDYGANLRNVERIAAALEAEGDEVAGRATEPAAARRRVRVAQPE